MLLSQSHPNCAPRKPLQIMPTPNWYSYTESVHDQWWPVKAAVAVTVIVQAKQWSTTHYTTWSITITEHTLSDCPFWCTCGNKYEHSREVNNNISNKNVLWRTVYPYNMKTGTISIWWYNVEKSLMTLATRKPFTTFIQLDNYFF